MTDLTGSDTTVKPDVPTQGDVEAIEAAGTALATAVEPIIKETKVGWKTTEFWMAVIGLLIVNLNGVIMTLPDKYQAIATAAIAAFYAVSRGQAKSGIPDVQVNAPSASA